MLRIDKINDHFLKRVQKYELFIGQYKGEDSVKEKDQSTLHLWKSELVVAQISLITFRFMKILKVTFATNVAYVDFPTATGLILLIQTE